MAKKIDNKITAVAVCEVSWPNGSQEIKRFDAAWKFGREVARTDGPVTISFRRYARID